MPFRTRYNVLFRQFRLLTAQAGSVPAAIRLIFENCYNTTAVVLFKTMCRHVFSFTMFIIFLSLMVLHIRISHVTAITIT